MDNCNIYVVQDGLLIDDAIKQLFSNDWDSQDLVMTQDGERINFVGFIYDNDKFLVSFPKHSFSEENLQKITLDKITVKKYVKLLFQCIHKTANQKSSKYAGVRKELNASYPFIDFFQVYQYYKTYGLFTNVTEWKKFGYAGKISWKDTINKSPKIVQNKKLLFYR